ncbi:MAG: hypothetical protein MZV65_52865 [Chromatiales bacterium]|nr:hypothetical protein [Chromatiales bacterium]
MKKNRWLLNLALALLVGALVLVALYRPGTGNEPKGTPLTALTADAVERVRIVRAGQAEIRLERQADGWRLDRAARGARQPLPHRRLHRPRRGACDRPFAAGTDLRQYGLEHPLATVFLNDIEIRFGALHPLASEVYVLQGGEVKLLPAAPAARRHGTARRPVRCRPARGEHQGGRAAAARLPPRAERHRQLGTQPGTQGPGQRPDQPLRGRVALCARAGGQIRRRADRPRADHDHSARRWSEPRHRIPGGGAPAGAGAAAPRRKARLSLSGRDREPPARAQPEPLPDSDRPTPGG